MKAKFGVFSVVLVCFGTLLFVSMASIIAMNAANSTQVFSRLLGQVVLRSAEGLELALRNHLEAAENQGDFIVDNLDVEDLKFENPDKLIAFITGSLAAAPQISGLIIANDSGQGIGVARDSSGKAQSTELGPGTPSDIPLIFDEVRSRKEPYWGLPAFSDTLGVTVMNRRIPIWQGDKFLGLIAIAISTDELSRLAGELSEEQTSVFVLYGRNRVLAHISMFGETMNISEGKPLPTLGEISDPIIKHLRSADAIPEIDSLDGARMSVVEVDGSTYGFITKPVRGYGDRPLIIGAYSTADDIGQVVKSMIVTVSVGSGVLVLALIGAWILSRRLTRPLRQTSEVAAAIATLEFDNVKPLPPSRLKEIDDLATSFNAMLIGLQSFGRYVPRLLVKRLIREHHVGAGTEQRELTVMFTDIVGFTSICEGMDPADVATFISEHLTLVSKCIEDEGGTIDKYIGDAVMAFWGAPENIDNANLRAMRAAGAIQAALNADNAIRTRANLPSVRIRIGVHSGQLIVGDIGSPDRLNYTVIGDIVNITQRLEALGKEVDAEAESIVLVSRDVRDSLAGQITFDEIGNMKVKGRMGEIEVFRLSQFAEPIPTFDQALKQS
ncbi:Adenylate cyclase, family 3 (some protein containing HAMP domain) [Hoeflea phototrophica DFL-43]|uniref:Adenylate cyclase, family 3 (Some protein containing HAMP domain) n=1 Tax=Hoeflea phototrophica (strain DSM 17068 / NCIMB 14078 / DFL-43) TaxID=411684 RepID=A9DAF1_HOEPD|nr:adenylate/guanylate cyclase domain-containing protein [Hoeflea phototrophica]EDQ32725.2 Adenylate cyclase, family 3 (some protein containing HAMP domain) [Hoeflea phototrophica DFL-43]